MDAALLQAILKGFLLPDFFNQRVEPILNLILGPPRNFLGYHSPLVADSLLAFKKLQVLLRGPLLTLDVR